MIEAVAILAALALGIALILLAPEIARWLAALIQPQRRIPNFCHQLCRYRIALAWLLGLLIGLFLGACWIYLEALTALCLTILFWALLLGLLTAIRYVIHVLACGWTWGKGLYPPLHQGPGRWRLALLIIALALFLLILAFAGFPLRALFVNTLCGWLVLGIVVVSLLFLVLYAWEVWFCDRLRPEKDCIRDERRWAILLLLFLIISLIFLWLCRDDLSETDAGLAMVGIHWDGKYPDESGAHLRWSFEPELGFPDGGFDLYRREPGAFGWTNLNAGRIHPVRAWSGAVPPGATGEWTPLGGDRLPPAVHGRYTGANADNFAHLLDMVSRDPTVTLFYVEGRDEPFLSEADAQAFAEAQIAADPNGPIPGQWEAEPISLLFTLALHSEVARLLGLYWIDTGADPNVEYDYRVVGYWGGVRRSWRVERLSRPNTAPLSPTSLQTVTAVPSVARPLPTGGYWPTEAHVTLRWTPPTSSPEVDLGQADGILPVFHRVERQDRGPIGGPPEGAPDPFAPIAVPSEAGAFVPADPVLVLPQEVEGQPDRWPNVFAYDGYVDYRTYGYRIIGIDLFGRESPPSNELQVDVTDQIAPPAPPNAEARLWQWRDPAVPRLLQSLRDSLFPLQPDGTPGNEIALQVSWLWPDAFAQGVQDLKGFRLYWRSTSGAAPGPWQGPLGPEVPAAAGQAVLPPRHAGIAATYYETELTSLPLGFLSAFAAGDTAPVLYGEIAVVAVDHDPFNNERARAVLVVVFARDLVPPDPPAAPGLLRSPSEVDRAGNATMALQVVPANALYSYRLYRVRAQRLTTLPDPPQGLGPGCVGDADPAHAALQARAGATPDLFGLVTPATVKPAAGTVEVTDTVDATVGQTFFYAATAIDVAGNESALSCPSVSIQTSDLMSPRAPVLTQALGAEGEIVLTWVRNREPDLFRYQVYRTAEAARLDSKRKMTLVLEADSAGAVQGGLAGVAAAVSIPVPPSTETRLQWRDNTIVPGRSYHYRLVAVDESGNSSEMSKAVAARAIDRTTPPVPQWPASGGAQPGTVPEGPFVELSWPAVSDPSGVSISVQRRTDGRPLWRGVSGWLADATQYRDATVTAARRYHFRLRAMDGAGNRSDWSAELTVDIP